MLPDRIETGTYAMAVAMTGGDVMLSGARADLLDTALDTLRESGAEVTVSNEGLRVKRNGAGIAPVAVTTEPFPGFPTDLQAQLMALTTRAKRHLDASPRPSSRTASCMCRSSPGSARASISTARTPPSKASSSLTGAPVMATDLRASVSLVIGALAAEGESMIHRVYHLDRGFERLEEKLSACGAEIERHRRLSAQSSIRSEWNHPGDETVLDQRRWSDVPLAKVFQLLRNTFKRSGHSAPCGHACRSAICASNGCGAGIVVESRTWAVVKLIALDGEDLAVLSVHLQDAVITVGDMTYPAEASTASCCSPTASTGRSRSGEGDGGYRASLPAWASLSRQPPSSPCGIGHALRAPPRRACVSSGC